MQIIMGTMGSRVLHEIVKVKTNVTVPANIFDLPRGYRMISEQQMRQRRRY
jgi:hypothetical protein